MTYQITIAIGLSLIVGFVAGVVFTVWKLEDNE